MRELQAIDLKLSRGSFKLRADNTALSELEELYDKPFTEIVDDLLGKMKIRDVCKVVAAFARYDLPKVTVEDVLKASPTLEDLKILRGGVQEALFAALPPKKQADGEAGEDAPPRPFENA